MALSATRLRNAIRVALLADPSICAIDNAGLTAFCAAIAAAVVAEVQLATVTVASGIPVTVAGSPSTQTGATTSPGSAAIT